MAAIVLSGGKSRRMGRDKATIAYGDTTLLAHAVAIVRSVTPDIYVVTSDPARYNLGNDVSVVGDLYPDAGPLGGIVTGLDRAGEGYHIVLACDMPRVSSEVLRYLQARASGHDGAAPVTASGVEPLCAVYRDTCLAAMRERVVAGRLAVHEALAELDIVYVTEEHIASECRVGHAFANVNTPEDLAQIEACAQELTHLDERGNARMVDVAGKADTQRQATATGRICLKPETLRLLRDGSLPKGDAVAAARIAGIMAAKRTSDLVPLCHPLPITKASVDLTIGDDAVEISATIGVTGKTGVEMEALTAVSVAALTIYDMVKAVDRAAVIGDIRLLRKSGGKSDFEANPEQEPPPDR